MFEGWRSNGSGALLPRHVVDRVAQRARIWDAARGGTYQFAGDLLLLWSGPFSDDRARPIGAVWMADPGDGTPVVVRRVAWDQATCSESQVWLALEMLAGDDWPAVRSASGNGVAR